MAPDGRSFVTAVAVQSGSAWVHDLRGERQISLEGNTVNVQFAPDGKTLYYKVVKSASSIWNFREVPAEVRMMDLDTGRSEALMPGLEALDNDVAADGERIVMEIADSDRVSRLWIVSLDRRSRPREIPGVQGRAPRFGPGGDIFFARTEGPAAFVYRVRSDGTELRKVFDQPIVGFDGISRDGQWIRAFAVRAVIEGPSWQAIPLDGGPSMPLGLEWRCATAEDSVAISGGPLPAGRSYIIPLHRSTAPGPLPSTSAATSWARDSTARFMAT